MLLMARKRKDGEDGYKSRLWHIKKELGIEAETLWKNLKLEMSLGAFNNYLYRDPPEWLLKKAERYYAMAMNIGSPLSSTGEGLLRVVASVGAGGHPDSQRDEEPLHVPIEFSHPDYRGMVIEQSGSSMMPYLHPGDTIVLKPQLIVKLGKFMVIRNDSSPTELFVKKAEFNGDRFIFKSLNPKHDDIVGDGYSLVGLVVGIISADQSIKIGPIDVGIDEDFIHSQLRSRLP